jgi:hypothetical protein
VTENIVEEVQEANYPGWNGTVEQPPQRAPVDPRLILTYSLVGLAALLVVAATVLLLAGREATPLIIVLSTVIGGLVGLFVSGPGSPA